MAEAVYLQDPEATGARQQTLREGIEAVPDDDELGSMLRRLVVMRNDAYRRALLAQTQYRNLLVITAGLLVVIAATVPFVAAAFDSRLVTLGSSADGTPVEVTWRQLLTVELWGAFGGAIGALVAVRRLRGQSGPLSIGVAQVAIKLPAGALVALFIILVLQAGIVADLDIVNAHQLAGYAAVFGLAEEAATRWVDRKASELLGRTADVAITS